MEGTLPKPKNCIFYLKTNEKTTLFEGASKTCFFGVRFGVRNGVIFDIRGLIGGLGFPKVWGCLRFGVPQSLGFQVWGSLALPWFGVPGLGFPKVWGPLALPWFGVPGLGSPGFAVVWGSRVGVP